MFSTCSRAFPSKAWLAALAQVVSMSDTARKSLLSEAMVLRDPGSVIQRSAVSTPLQKLTEIYPRTIKNDDIGRPTFIFFGGKIR